MIATYDNHEMLRTRALPSVLAQTYERLEVVVAGDAAPEQAGAAVAELGDERFRFVNRGYRGPYPEDDRRKWLVTGVPPWNDGTQIATGRWIASLDDDDAWRPDHVERLVALARREHAEFAYGAVVFHPLAEPGLPLRLGAFPPEQGWWNMQATIYHAGLAPMFAPELGDATFGLPCDWAMARRMMRAGVRMAFEDVETVDYYASPGRLA